MGMIVNGWCSEQGLAFGLTVTLERMVCVCEERMVYVCEERMVCVCVNGLPFAIIHIRLLLLENSRA